MTPSPAWANLAIVTFKETYGYAIGTISLNADSCHLAGAWQFQELNDDSLQVILRRKLILMIGVQKELINPKTFSSLIVDIPSFIHDSKQSAIQGAQRLNSYIETNIKEYETYMSISPTERKSLPKVIKKKLEPMNSHSWNLTFDEKDPQATIRQLGKRESIAGTPKEMEFLISTSWLVKYLLDRWRADESERTSRDYLDSSYLEFKILPESWMNQRKKLEQLA